MWAMALFTMEWPEVVKHRLCEMASQADNPIILSYTNKAVENVKSVFRELNQPELAKKCYTFDLYFFDQYGRDIHSLKDKTIFIDEFSMIPLRWMTLVYQAFSIYHNQVFMFGDPNQCNSVEKTKVYYDYHKSISISEMCPKRVKMKYKPECARYDTPTKEFLDKFLQTYKIEETMLLLQPSYTNICYLNKTRGRITEDCCNRFSADKESILVGFQ